VALVGDRSDAVVAHRAIPRAPLAAAGLRFTGFDAAGEVCAGELPTHPFFVGILFQPERSGLRGERHPLISAFVRSAAAAGPVP
jgi:CTP synthase (UTP-ammonia lyase)